MPAAVSVSTQPVRVRAAVAAVGWAYFSSISRGDNVRGNELLVAFQTLWNTDRRTIIAGIPDPAAESTFPTALAVDGRYGPNSRLALLGTLAATTRDGSVSLPGSAITSMPASSGGISNWFRTIQSNVPPTNPLWAIDTLAMRTVPNKLYAQTLTTVSALVSSDTWMPAPTSTLPAAPPTGGANTSRAPDGAPNTNPRTDIRDGLTVRSSSGKGLLPLWGWILLGVGGAAALGGLAWAGYRYKKYGKVFR
jgi:hypothetical protein